MPNNIIKFPEPEITDHIVFACAECNAHEFGISLEYTGLIFCLGCGEEHPDGIKWAYKDNADPEITPETNR